MLELGSLGGGIHPPKFIVPNFSLPRVFQFQEKPELLQESMEIPLLCLFCFLSTLDEGAWQNYSYIKIQSGPHNREQRLCYR